MPKTEFLIRILFLIILCVIAFFAGLGIFFLVNTYYHPSTVIPANYQGYYLTEFKNGNNVYNHITHITGNHLITTNGVYQAKNRGSYDALPANHQFARYSLDFKVNKFHQNKKIRNSGYFTGHVLKQTTPKQYFKHVHSYKSLPPIQTGKIGMAFLGTNGIVKKIKNKHIKVVINGLRIPKSEAKTIKIDDSENM